MGSDALTFRAEFGAAVAATARPANVVLPRIAPAPRRIEGRAAVSWTAALGRRAAETVPQTRSA